MCGWGFRVSGALHACGLDDTLGHEFGERLPRADHYVSRCEAANNQILPRAYSDIKIVTIYILWQTHII